jgi:hypothetical protein
MAVINRTEAQARTRLSDSRRPEMPEKTPEEIAAAKAKAEDEAKEKAKAEAKAEEDVLKIEGEFDPERALTTIRAQRKVERELKAELAELRSLKDEKAEAEAAEVEAAKGQETKIAERDATIESLNVRLGKQEVEYDFKTKAAALGVEDLDLAYLAAERAGLLGDYDEKAETVGDHDFDKLAEKYPSIIGESSDDTRQTGDGGARKSGKKADVGTQFNRTVRDAFRR